MTTYLNGIDSVKNQKDVPFALSLSVKTSVANAPICSLSM